MNERIREQVRAFVHSDLLDEFESLTVEVDDLRKRLNAETAKDKAWSLALKWATIILSLTRLESALLSGVLPILEESLAETEEEVIKIRQQREEAEQMVYEFRREVGHLRPFNSEADKKRHAEAEKAKEERNKILFNTGQRLQEISLSNAPVRAAIGQIKLSIRSLRHFQENRFPQPVKKLAYRNMAGPAPIDPSKDRFRSFCG